MNKLKKQSQKGVLLVELLIGMATIAILAIGMVSCFSMLIKMHGEIIGNLVLQEQVRFLADSLINDLNYANQVQLKNQKVLIFINNGALNQKIVIYELNGGRIMKDTQPITGGDKAVNIIIKEFSCRKFNESTVIIKIKACNQKSFKEFELETGVVLLNNSANNKIIAINR